MTENRKPNRVSDPRLTNQQASMIRRFLDDGVPLPPWLAAHDLEAVKSNLVSVVIAVLAVLFLREAVAWDGGRDILGFGAALGLVICALGLYLRVRKHE